MPSAKISQSGPDRDLVTAFRGQTKGGIEQGLGLWARHGFDEDGLAFQERHRRSGRRV